MKTDWHERISQPKYNVKVEKDVYVAMRDGVHLAVDIFRPDAKGRFPALLAISPYGKETQQLQLPPQALGISPLWDGNLEAGDTEYIVSRGYAHIIGDVRGTGYSEGEYVGFHSEHKQEGKDGHDLVEWIAQQPWCNGNVGMVGYSYFGEVQLFVASEQPPHLRAICPAGVWVDLYRGMAYHGGILNLFLYGLWDGRLGTSGFAPNKVVSAMMKNLGKEEFERRIQEALSNPDVIRFPNLCHLLHYPKKNPLFVDLVLNPYDGPFYWERSAYTEFERIKVPVFTIGSWGHAFSAWGSLALYCGINSPKKIMIYPPGMPDRPWRQGIDTIIRWYDHWLKGMDTGIMDEPPITFFVTGVNQWRYEQEWPLPNIEPKEFYLRSWGGLSSEPETSNDEPDCFLQEPLHMSSKTQSLEYLSPPILEDMEVMGDVALYLFASIDADDTNWIAGLSDVDERGVEQLLGRGYLKASHRTLDESKSMPLRPYHPHMVSEPVVPGQIYKYAIEVTPVVNVFKAGHRMKLEIKSMESPKDPENLIHFHPHLCSSKTTVHRIYRDKQHKSCLFLSVIPKKKTV